MLNEGYRVTLEHQGSHWWYRARRELFLRQVRCSARALGHPGRSLSLLDYGCASGFDLDLLSEVGTAEGADIAEVATFIESHPSFHMRQPIHTVPRDMGALVGRFDIVTCLDVLEHLDDDIEGLRNLASCLVPGGQAVITVPAFSWLWSGEDVISAHRRRYTRGSLLDACKRAGFEVLHASYFNLSVLPAMAAVIWARRLFREDWRSMSNLTASAGWLDSPIRAITAFEARCVGHEWVSLPAGTSVVCRLRRPEPAPWPTTTTTSTASPATPTRTMTATQHPKMETA